MSQGYAMRRRRGTITVPSASEVDTEQSAVNRDDHPWVDKEHWPAFDRYEYNVIFEELQGDDLEMEHGDSSASDKKKKQDEDLRTHMKQFLVYIKKAGMDYKLVKSPSNPKQITAMIRADEAWYNKTASDLKLVYEMKPIKRVQPDDQLQDGQPAQTKFITNFYQVYNASDANLFLYHGMHNRFTSYRQQLLEYMLRERIEDGGCNMHDYMKATKKHPKIIVNAFPEHEDHMKDFLHNRWILGNPMKAQPLDQIRAYLGEKIAFYFAWLNYFNKWLVVPSIVGAIIAIYLATLSSSERNRSFLGVVYGACIVLWMTFFLEFWKRKSNYLSFKWGVMNYSEREADRPEYDAPCERFNQFTLESEKYYPASSRTQTMFFSQPAVAFMITLVFTIMFFILMWKNAIMLFSAESGKAYLTYVPPIVNAVVIIIMGNVHKTVALKLNDMENYRTQSEYEGALILKIFIFEFVNNFTSLIFIAFFAPGNKMDSLYFTMFIQLGIKQIISNLMEIGGPMVANKKAEKKLQAMKKESQNKEFSWSDILAENDPYDTFDDFKEIVIQFGYVMFFAAAFPGAAALALFNNVFEIKLDAFNILYNEPRPSAERGSGIGVWYQILEIMSFLAIVSNALVAAITSESLAAIFYNVCVDELDPKNLSNVTQSQHPAYQGNPELQLSFVQAQCRTFCSRVAASWTPEDNSDLTYSQQTIMDISNCQYVNDGNKKIGLIGGKGGPPKDFVLNSEGPVTSALWAMFIFEHVCVIMKFILMAIVPDVPSEIEEQVRGHELYKDIKLLEANEDDPEFDGSMTARNREAVEEATSLDFDTIPNDDRTWQPYHIQDLLKPNQAQAEPINADPANKV